MPWRYSPSLTTTQSSALQGRLTAKKKTLAPASPRTVNLDLTALRNVLKAAAAEDKLSAVPVIRDLDTDDPDAKRLVTPEGFAALLDAVPRACRLNAETVAFYLRFLAATGAREVESLSVRWQSVDFAARTLTIGVGGVAKNRKTRRIEFNAPLETLLEEMKTAASRDKLEREARGHTGFDSVYLFPSPRRKRGEDRPAKSSAAPSKWPAPPPASRGLAFITSATSLRPVA